MQLLKAKDSSTLPLISFFKILLTLNLKSYNVRFLLGFGLGQLHCTQQKRQDFTSLSYSKLRPILDRWLTSHEREREWSSISVR